MVHHVPLFTARGGYQSEVMPLFTALGGYQRGGQPAVGLLSGGVHYQDKKPIVYPPLGAIQLQLFCKEICKETEARMSMPRPTKKS